MQDLFTAAAARPLDFFPLHNCCQLFGLDFLVDRNLQLHLLEANADPSLSIFGGRLRPACMDMMRDVAALTACAARRFARSSGTGEAAAAARTTTAGGSGSAQRHEDGADAGSEAGNA